MPDDQTRKLALISDASLLLDTTINPFTDQAGAERRGVRGEPDGDSGGAEQRGGRGFIAGRAAMRRGSADVLNKLAKGDARIARAGERRAGARAEDDAAADERVASGRAAVSVATMPPDMVADWVAKDGTARIQVFPKDISGSNASLNSFSKAVLRVAPDATGAPISIRESGTTIVVAFEQAGALSFVVITALLLIVLRRWRDVMLAVIPLVLTGALDHRNGGRDRTGAQLRQHHRAAASVRHRGGVQDLFRDGVARRPDRTCCNRA